MKKSILLINVLIAAFSLVGCGDHIDNHGIVQINESCKIYTDDEHVATITYNNCDSEEIESNSTLVLIKETITIVPTKKLFLRDSDFILSLGYESFDTRDDWRRSDKEYNIAKNQYDIFKKPLEDETTYEFCFIVLKEKDGTRYDNIGIFFEIFNTYTLCYMFE